MSRPRSPTPIGRSPYYEVFYSEGTIYTAGEDSFLASLIDIAGAEPVTGDATGVIDAERSWRPIPSSSCSAARRTTRPSPSPPRRSRPWPRGPAGATSRRSIRDVVPYLDDIVTTRPGPRIVDGSRRWPARSTPTGSSDRMSATTAARPLALGPSLGRSTVVLGVGLALLAVAGAVAVALGTSGVGPDQALAIVVHRSPGSARSPGRRRRRRSSWSWAAPRRRRDRRRCRPRLRGDGLPGRPAQPARRSVHHRHGRRRVAGGGGRADPAGRDRRLARDRRGPGVRVRRGARRVLVVYAVARQRGGTPACHAPPCGLRRLVAARRRRRVLLFASGDRLAAVVSWLLGSLAGASWPRLAIAGPAHRHQLHAHPLPLAPPERPPPRGGGGRASRHRRRAREADPHRARGAAHLGRRRDLGHDRLRRAGGAAPAAPRVRPDHRLLLPASMVYGALLLLVADLGARSRAGSRSGS